MRGAREMDVDLGAGDGGRDRRDGLDRRRRASSCSRRTSRTSSSSRATRRGLRKLPRIDRGRRRCTFSYTTDVRAAVPAGAARADRHRRRRRRLVEPEDLQTGAVVCELSLPHDVGRRVARERPDVLVTEGGNMRVPGDAAVRARARAGPRLRPRPPARDRARVHVGDDGPGARGPARMLHARTRHRPREGARDRRARRRATGSRSPTCARSTAPLPPTTWPRSSARRRDAPAGAGMNVRPSAREHHYDARV